MDPRYFLLLISFPSPSLQEDYAKEFTTFKPDKKLRWLPHLGTVQLEIVLQDRTIEVEVPPLEAAFIELFAEKGALTHFFRLGLLRSRVA